MPEARAGDDPAAGSLEREPIGLLVCRDLIFLSKIKGTAEALGYLMIAVGDVNGAKAALESRRPRVVMIDLSAGAAAAPDAIAEYLRITGTNTRFVGFGSHVDTEVLAAAKRAGCHSVLPRSKLSRELPLLLRSYFGEQTGE